MLRMTNKSRADAPDSFERAAVSAMGGLSSAFSELVAALGGSIRRPVDLERALELEPKLAWQVFRIALAEAPLAEAGNVPSRPSVQKLVAAAASRGVPESVIKRMDSAIEAFEECAARHAGDREGLLSLVHGVPNEASNSFHLKIRKSLFRPQAYLWGVQARALLRTAITPPVAPGSPVKWVLLSGNIGVQRLRGDAPATISSWMRKHTPEGKIAAKSSEDDLGIEVLTEFCSDPPPRILSGVNYEGSIQIELALPQTGLLGASSMYLCRAQENAADARLRGSTEQMMITTPTQEVVYDMLVPAGWTNPATARVGIFGNRYNVNRAFEEIESDRLPQQETIRYMGALDTVPPIALSQRHADAVRHVLERHGCLGTRFDVYRCRVQFPALHTVIVMRVDPATAAGGPRQ
jgi:hypothetical protein